MGREVKRVTLDFDWPLDMPWKGYVNPYSSQKCKACDGSGFNPATKQLLDDWYDFSNSGSKWHNRLTQDEVDALVEYNRLREFTQNGQRPTAEMVNRACERQSIHDAINRFICLEVRAKRLGVYGQCKYCGGDGEIYFNERIKQLADDWDEKEKYDPPEGEGWQVWETVSEGSPVTPVFQSAEALVDYLVEHGDDPKRVSGWKRENAEKFVNAGWAPSLIVIKDKDGGRIITPRDGGQF